jgi:hypothetical protein
MQLILSAHALERMAERNITESDIGALIRNCPKPRRDMKDNAIYYVSFMAGLCRLSSRRHRSRYG